MSEKIKPQLVINSAGVNFNKLAIEATLICDYDAPTPKIKAIFEREGELRRLPLLLKSSVRRADKKDCINIFSYKYNLDYIFNQSKPDCQISVGFEVYFTDDIDENVKAVFASNLTADADNDADGDAGDGAFEVSTFYANPYSTADKIYTGDLLYTMLPCVKENELLIDVKANHIIKSPITFRVFSRIAGAIVGFFNFIYCLILLPYFVLNGVLAGLNLIPRHKYKPSESILSDINGQIKTNIASFLKNVFKGYDMAGRLIHYKEIKLINHYNRLCKKRIINNRVSFISGRRDTIGGNEEFVYNLLRDRTDIDFQFLMCSDTEELKKPKNLKRFYELYATSKVVIVDDYFTPLNTVAKRDDVTLFQLWHACGAFKTFGFSRLGKPGGPKQTVPYHRMYDKVTVSSEGIRKYYAEGFGIDESKVIATGVPRTDIFFDEEYKQKITEELYLKYPQLQNKKIILFAPTFRGNGQRSAYYPLNMFNPAKLIDELGEEYAVILKLHPFCGERYEISEGYKNNILDLSEADELNDLLFITDLLITDYSSCVFEASLLNIPMLFYAFDLYQYISDRDFYCDFTTFVPGKIIFDEQELLTAIKNKDFDVEKVEPFKNKFFSHPDGKASERVALEVLKALE